MSDALATSELFSTLRKSYIERYGHSRFKKEFDAPLNYYQAQSNGFQKVEYRRKKAQTKHQKEKRKIDQFLNRLPTENLSDNDLEKQEYLDILSNVLADRILSDDEVQTLYGLAKEFHFSKKDVLHLHKQYLREVIQVYLIDDVVSNFERSDLENLSCLLGINIKELDELIDIEKQKSSKLFRTTETQSLNKKSICFTGKLQSKIDGKEVSRSQAQKFAQQKGMIIKKNISKKVDLLVTAKPNSMSGKAKKARKYNIPIIAEPEFWKLVGVNVE